MPVLGPRMQRTRVSCGVHPSKACVLAIRVLTLAANSFSSHVTVKASFRVVAIPEGMSTAAAATIPVALATAYYSLVKAGAIWPHQDRKPC